MKKLINKNQKGFTLIEMLIVMIIVGILCLVLMRWKNSVGREMGLVLQYLSMSKWEEFKNIIIDIRIIKVGAINSLNFFTILFVNFCKKSCVDDA